VSRLWADRVTLSYRRGEAVARNLSFRVPDGAVTSIIGPNGCGKSTLLRALARLMAPASGVIVLDGEAIHRQPTKEVAKRLGLLPQQQSAPEAIVVEDLVRRGRYPHRTILQPLNAADHAAVERALELAGVAELRQRPVDELSGGQRQKVWIAMALAQETPILLLDEPTTYLDLTHQQEVLALIRRLNREEGRTIVTVLHDVNAAAWVSDYVVAMHAGEIVAQGSPGEVLKPEVLRRIFGVECDVVECAGSGIPWCIARGRSLLRALELAAEEERSGDPSVMGDGGEDGAASGPNRAGSVWSGAATDALSGAQAGRNGTASVTRSGGGSIARDPVGNAPGNGRKSALHNGSRSGSCFDSYPDSDPGTGSYSTSDADAHSPPAALRTERLGAGYESRRVVQEVSVSFPAGKVSAIVGPNACGKSTLLRALARLLPAEGQVWLNERPIRERGARQLARELGLLAQEAPVPSGVLVEELVASGRYPYQRWFRQWTAEDERAVERALEVTATAELRWQPVEALSGGQRQRVRLAMALAQTTPVLLLDEPTTFLDMAHQIEVLELIRELNATEGKTVIMVLHDLCQACYYADHLVVMKDGKVVAQGPPSDIVTEDLVRDVFGTRCAVVPDPLTGTPLVVPRNDAILSPVARQ